MASTSNAGRQHSFWKHVWFVVIPPKIKNFIWRACTDSLPLQTKLFDRKISNSFSCVLCLEAAESCTHLLWECSFAQVVWLQAPFQNSIRLPLHIQFMEVIDMAIHKLQTPELEIFFRALWMIWNCQNKLIFKNKEPSQVYGIEQLLTRWNSWRSIRCTQYLLEPRLLDGHLPFWNRPSN